jgi:hypothetical protein
MLFHLTPNKIIALRDLRLRGSAWARGVATSMIDRGAEALFNFAIASWHFILIRTGAAHLTRYLAEAANLHMRLFPASITFFLIVMGMAFKNRFPIKNETDILPSIRQFWDASWLPNDWYLNLDIGYRALFNFLTGPVVSGLGFEQGAVVTRLTIFAVISCSLAYLVRSFRMNVLLGIIVLFFFLRDQSLAAGEWIVGGVETKSMAYAFVFLSLGAFFNKKYFVGFGAAGAALSFHILIGFYALFCLCLALLLNWRDYLPDRWAMAKSSLIFPITGALGLIATVKELLAERTAHATRAWDIYVTFRVPHHLLPAHWPGAAWKVQLAAAGGLFLVAYATSRSRAIRFTSGYALASLALFIAGLTFSGLGEITWLRLYWFRHPDVMIPFLSAFLIGLILNDLVLGKSPSGLIPRKILTGSMPKLLSFALLLFSLVIVGKSLWQLEEELFIRDRHEHTSPQEMEILPMLNWISQNTSTEATFLVDPLMNDFYLNAQRAVFVLYKHSPQSAKDISEWYHRLTLCNKKLPPSKAKEISRNFHQLPGSLIREISRAYGITYYLCKTRDDLPFTIVHKTPTDTLYLIQ